MASVEEQVEDFSKNNFQNSVLNTRPKQNL